MNITLKKLSLENFKGSGKNTLNFSQETNILGANGTGKTTLADAFTWLLFGKDSTDRKDFSIKPLDLMGKPTDKLEVEVSATIEVDGMDTIIKRGYREKWVKKRGEEEAEFNGNETVFSWNEVPLSQKEFTEKINGIMSENIFKVVTNPLYFNSLKWQDKRSILIAIAGGVTDIELANTEKYKALLNTLNSGKTIEEYKKELAAKTKKIREEMKVIPSRIDEASKSIKPIETQYLESLIESHSKDLSEIESEINNASKAQKAEQETLLKLQKESFELESDLNKVINCISREIIANGSQIRNDIDNLKHQVFLKQQSIINSNATIKQRQNSIETLENEVILLRVDFVEISKKSIEFDDDSFICPTCKRVHDTDDIEAKKEEMAQNFNDDKAKKTQAIREKGKVKNADIEKLKASNFTDGIIVKGLSDSVSEIEKNVKNLITEQVKESEKDKTFELEEILFSNIEYKVITENLEKCKEAIANRPTVEQANDDLTERKKAAEKDLDELKGFRVQKTLNNLQEKRIEELNKEMKTMSSELNSLEKMEFLIQEFTKDKISSLEAKVNAKFDYVNFKMFETQVNGGETETCEILVNGVPFNDANTAGKAVAGIDIINTLSEHYQIFAPIWIDNRESVTSIQPTKSQIINLLVSQNHKNLTVENGNGNGI